MNYSNQVLQVKLGDIVPNRFQPRENFENDGIEELAKSIKEHGIIQPLVLRRLGDKYEIIAGERRFKAATLAGLETVPAIISDISDQKSAEVALVENIQRRNLSAIEEARSYKAIIDSQNITQEELAVKMGLSQSAIANKLRLLNLCDEVQNALMTQKISERHARSLLNIEDKEEQKKWLDRILNERLTVRQLDMEIKKVNPDTPTNEVAETVNLNKMPNIEEIKMNAQDIIVPPEVKNLDNILTPDANLTKIDEENKTMNEVENNNQEQLNSNRFFNFLEDIGPNMMMEDPVNLINQNVGNEVENIDDTTANDGGIEKVIEPEVPNAMESIPNVTNSVEDINNFNPFSEPTPTPPAPNLTPEVSAPITNDVNPFVDNFVQPSPMINEPTVAPAPTIEPLPEVNTFNPFQDNFEVPVEPVVNNDVNPFMEPQVETPINNPSSNLEANPFIDPVTNPVLETPVPPEPAIFNSPEIDMGFNSNVVDPMSNVDLLDPNREEKIEQVQTTLVSIAITSLRNSITQLEKQGFMIDVEELDLDDKYQITISIQK